MVHIDVVCPLRKFRTFLIYNTCQTFIPKKFLKDPNIFPERFGESGSLYVEAEQKEYISQIRDVQFVRARNVLGIIYNSKSGRTRLKWRHLEGGMGRLTGEASTNSLVNLFASGILSESFIDEVGAQHQAQQGAES